VKENQTITNYRPESTKELVRKKGRKCLHNKNENALQATAKSED
jgi:hypothetical protein